MPGLLILLVGLFLAGSWYGRKTGGAKADGGRRILYYVDPMNPAHTSPDPGLAPCGMKLEPVYADGGAQGGDATMPPGSVKITPEKQQMIGVRVATVEKSPQTFTLRTVGKVAVDETRIYRLTAFIEGWVVKIFNNTTGSLIRKDEPLATFYNRDLPTMLQTYYYALDAVARMMKDPQLQQTQKELLVAQKLTAEGVLMNLGMGRPQMDELARSRQVTQEISITAPATSFVLARNITPGQRFGPGEELYRLADLSRVWIVADLFEKEGKYIRPGEKVTVTLPGQGQRYLATVSEVLPEFDPATLTLKVRLEMDNPDFTLRPGMFTDVDFPIHMPAAVNVPVDAVLDAGLKKTVFVQRGNGFFEPRRVKTGWRLGDRVEIVEGLEPGEHIVISGNFLIDSESRMKLAAAGFFGNVVKDPVCGMDLDEGKARSAGRKSDQGGQTYYFCSDACQKKFEQMPGRYAAKPETKPISPQGDSTAPPHQTHQAQPAAETAKDPVCGMAVAKGTAQQDGLTLEYQGKTYYFCSAACLQQFSQNQHQTAKPEAEAAPPAPDQMAAHQAHQAHQAAHQAHQKSQTPDQATKDPVCGLQVATGTARQAGRTSEFQGKTYYFDTDGCKQRFDQNPQRYLTGGPAGSAPSSIAIQPYPEYPQESNVFIRFKRTLMRTAPQEPSQAAPPGTKPNMPQAMPRQAAPTAPQGPGQVMPHGAAAPQGSNQGMPHGMTPAVPAPTETSPPAAPGSHAMSHGPAPAAPQTPAQAKPPVQQTQPSKPPAPTHAGEHPHD